MTTKHKADVFNSSSETNNHLRRPSRKEYHHQKQQKTKRKIKQKTSFKTFFLIRVLLFLFFAMVIGIIGFTLWQY